MTETELESFRREPPAPLAPRPLNLPVPQEATLANGLRVIFVENERLPLVTYRLAFRTGPLSGPKLGFPALQVRVPRLAGLLQCGRDEVVQRGEVVRGGTERHPGPSGDRPVRGSRDPDLGHDLNGGREQSAAPAFGVP